MAIAPRLFLRELVDVMDRVDLHPDYDPLTHYQLELDASELNDEELAARNGQEPAGEEDEPEQAPAKRLEG